METDRTKRKRMALPLTDNSLPSRDNLAEYLKHWRQKLGFYSLFAAVPAILAAGTQAQDEQAGNAPVPEAKTSERPAGFLGMRKRSLAMPPFMRQASGNRFPNQNGKQDLVSNPNQLVPNLVAGGNDDCPGTPVPVGTYTVASPYSDTDNTTGANNTVNTLNWYYYYSYPNYYAAYGPDRLYSFNLYSSGANSKIEVTTTSPTYRPMIYLIRDDQGCPAGTGNDIWSWSGVDDSRWQVGSNTATISLQGWSSGRYHLFVDSSVADDAGAYTVRIQDIVVGPNRPPVANTDSFTVYKNSSWNIVVLDNDTDPDHDWLTVSSVTQGSNGSVAINADSRAVTYTPKTGFTGTDTFTYTMSDGQGGAAIATVTVTVLLNEPPVANNDSATVYSSGLWQFVNVLANDTDPDGNSLYVSAVTQSSHGSVQAGYFWNGSRYVYGVYYMPNVGFTGADTFTYTANDGRGGTATGTVTVNVLPNRPPVANNDSVTVYADSGANTINVLANDSDPDGGNPNVTSVTQASHGSVSSDGYYVYYTPNAGFTGLDTFTYTVTDPAGETATANVTVNVFSNAAPIANDDSVSVGQDSGWTSINVLANDTDPDGNPLSISGFTQGSNGSISWGSVGSTVQYRPNPGFTGVDSFTYTVSDGRGATDTATVTVTVKPFVNYALAANGGIATASTTYSSSYPASGANNGDRKGANWGNGGGWNDATSGAYADWLEVSFDGSKSISRIDVFTVQDNYQSPQEPQNWMGFSKYGITAFDIQYWNGSDWMTVPGGGITNNTNVWRSLTFSPIETTDIRIRVNSALASYSRITEVEAWGEAVVVNPNAPVNVALARNGGVATASSTYSSSYPASGTNNGDRNGINWAAGGGWNDATANSQPDWLEIAFNGEKTINEIDVFTVQDNYQNPVRPNETMTFAQYGITAFDVQYWNGSSWVYVAGGSITNNNKVWRKLTFDSVQTSKIRILVNGASAGYSRIVEVEAWTTTDSPPPPPTPGPRMNFALAANGGTASASSTYNSGFPASGANNGDRKGTNWANGGGWNDSTANAQPDWLEVAFNGAKMVDEIDVFTIQDDYNNPVEPAAGATFTKYGITAFDVQYWDGLNWVTVPSGSITNNNKIWTKLTFSAVQTTKIRVFVNAVMAGYSRVVEVEAHGAS